MRRKALVPVPSAPHHIKHAKKRKAYVLVPPAPYRIKTMREAYVSASPAPHRLPGQGSHSHPRSHANSSTSALLVTRGELQPTVNRPEQRVPLSQVDGKAPCRQSRHRAAITSHATSRSTKYFTELTAESITDKVMERLKRFDSMWTNPTQPMGSFDTLSNTMEASTVSRSISTPVSSSSVPAVPRRLGSTSGPPARMSAVSRSPLSPSSPDSILLAATGLERNPSAQDFGSGFFVNAQNVIINGGTFISNVHLVNTGGGQMKSSVSLKPNSSPMQIRVLRTREVSERPDLKTVERT